ncbi:lin-52 [Aphelenchoides avenae]|nr:lin-52 [Aphelenchus avenae]
MANPSGRQMLVPKTEPQEYPHTSASVRPSSSLLCTERIDRASPEIFKETVPGAWDFNKETTPLIAGTKPSAKFKTELDPDDVKLVNELGQLSPDQLMEYVRNLQNNAYILGDEEARQFTRAKTLKIFDKTQ